eukprot:225283-Pleurochrysis_carterae.AAC.1
MALVAADSIHRERYLGTDFIRRAIIGRRKMKSAYNAPVNYSVGVLNLLYSTSEYYIWTLDYGIPNDRCCAQDFLSWLDISKNDAQPHQHPGKWAIALIAARFLASFRHRRSRELRVITGIFVHLGLFVMTSKRTVVRNPESSASGGSRQNGRRRAATTCTRSQLLGRLQYKARGAISQIVVDYSPKNTVIISL